MNLDVGCGALQHGQQIQIEDTFRVDVQRGPLVDLVCDGQHLPFREKVFDESYCFNTLEHMNNPLQAVKDLIRVTEYKVELIVPHKWGSGAKGESHRKYPRPMWHVCTFKRGWFHKVLRNYCHVVRVHWDFPRNIWIQCWIYLKRR